MSPEVQLGVVRLASLYEPIVTDLQAAQQILTDELISDQGMIVDLVQHVRQYHGKMLRPALLLLSARAIAPVTRHHHVLAAVVELVHIATLVHDDVLDEADIRRRAGTVNRLWGNERAVLMGDFLISHAFHLCSSLDSQFASRKVGSTSNTLCEGEIMQVANRDNFELTEAEYLDIITRKTAALVATSCELGAQYGGADPATVQRFRRYGECCGIAFQIVDDLLDITGSEADTGKSLGRDVQKGKLTLALIHYLANEPADARTRMLAHLRSEDPQRHRQAATLLQESESLHYAQSAAEHYVAEARASLADLPHSPAKDSLLTLAEFILSRRH